MLKAFEFIATICATIFAGAALYINIVEHPARMELETKMAALHWAPSYKRATLLQAPLALVSFCSGVVAWILGAGLGWLVAALLIGAVVPVTYLVIMPTNHKLLTSNRDLSSPETRALLELWGVLHAIRTCLSLLSSGLYLWLTHGV